MTTKKGGATTRRIFLPYSSSLFFLLVLPDPLRFPDDAKPINA